MTKKIFLIDDSESIHWLVKASLEAHTSIEFHGTLDPHHFISQASRIKPDLFLVDLCMPGIQGDDLVKHIREQAKFNSTPICLLTACEEREQVARLERTYGIKTIRKPFSVEKFVAEISSILDA